MLMLDQINTIVDIMVNNLNKKKVINVYGHPESEWLTVSDYKLKIKISEDMSTDDFKRVYIVSTKRAKDAEYAITQIEHSREKLFSFIHKYIENIIEENIEPLSESVFADMINEAEEQSGVYPQSEIHFVQDKDRVLLLKIVGFPSDKKSRGYFLVVTNSKDEIPERLVLNSVSEENKKTAHELYNLLTQNFDCISV